MHPVMHPLCTRQAGCMDPEQGKQGVGGAVVCHLQKSGKQFHATL